MTTYQLSLLQMVALGLSECRGSWRRLSFFIVCLAIGVGAMMTIESFSSLIECTITREAKSLLAADIEIKSSWILNKQDHSFLTKSLPHKSVFHPVKELKAMARYTPKNLKARARASLLIELKALRIKPSLYPMYGHLKTEPEGELSDLLSGYGALVEPSFLVRTGLKIGDTLQLGEVTLAITGEIIAEPDRISRSFSIGPRLMISLKTLKETRLIRIGSKVEHRTLIQLPEGVDLRQSIILLESELSDKTATIRSYKSMQSSLNSTISQMSQYLSCVGVIALLMGGIGVAMIVRTFLTQKLDTIAVLSCLGAASRTIFLVYFLQSLMLGLMGSGLGIGLGYLLLYLLPQKMEGLLNISVEPVFYLNHALKIFMLGLLTTFLFSMWPLIHAVKTRPLRLFRHLAEEKTHRDSSLRSRWAFGIVFASALLGILFWQAGSLKRGLIFFAAIAISIGLLGSVSRLFLFYLKKLSPFQSMIRRYGIANIHRPNNQAVSIITALGMGIMLILTLRLVQLDMLSILKENAEINPPNYFFIDIQPDQEADFLKALDSRAPEAERVITPLIRSRLYRIDGRDIDHWEFQSIREERWFKREFVLTYNGGLPPLDNEILEGKWWSKEDAKKPQVSLEEDAALRLGARIGSTLTMDIQGVKVEAIVTSIRRVNWRNMRTNFYMIFSTGALEGAPASLVATVHVPPGKELEVQQAIVEILPNVTALSTLDIVETIENVISKLIALVDFMSVFSILAGLFILSGAVASTKFRRLKESAVLKALGAKRGRVAVILGVEYASFGFIAAFIGSALSLVLSWAVMKYLVRAPWNFYPMHLATTFFLAIGLTIFIGILSSLDVLKNKPFYTLRQINA